MSLRDATISLKTEPGNLGERGRGVFALEPPASIRNSETAHGLACFEANTRSEGNLAIALKSDLVPSGRLRAGDPQDGERSAAQVRLNAA